MKALPTTLRLNGRVLQSSGAGRSPGSYLYLDMAGGTLHELFLGQVETAGPAYCVVALAGNPALRQLHVPHQAAQANGMRPGVGDVVLVEPDFANSVPGTLIRAKACGIVRAATRPPAPAPAPRPQLTTRHRGTLAEIHGNAGHLIEDGSGERVFIHAHQVHNLGKAFRPGLRLSYQRSQNSQGPCAARVEAT